MASGDLYQTTGVKAYGDTSTPNAPEFQIPEVYGYDGKSGLFIPVRRFKPREELGDLPRNLFASVLTGYFGLSSDQVGDVKDWPNKAYAGETNGINLRDQAGNSIGYATTLFVPSGLAKSTTTLIARTDDTSAHITVGPTEEQLRITDIFWETVLDKESVQKNGPFDRAYRTHMLVGHPLTGEALIASMSNPEGTAQLLVLEKGVIPNTIYRTAAIIAGLAVSGRIYRSSTPLSISNPGYFALVLHTSEQVQ